MPKKVIVSGGTGLIGSRIAEMLKMRGYGVCILSRNPGKAKQEVPVADEYYDIDKDLTPVIDGSFGMINLAGASLVGKRWTDEYKKLILDSRVETTNKIVEAIKNSENKPEVLISASAVGYYGNRNRTITEDLPPGDEFLAEVCVKWEEAAKKAEDFTCVIRCRLSAVLDKNEGALAKMLTPFKFFIGGPIGDGRQWFPWLHLEDAAGIFVWALENEVPAGAYNCTAPDLVRMNEFAKTLGRVLSRPAIFTVPEFAVKIVMGEAAVSVLVSQKIPPNKLSEAGYKHQHPELEPALRDLLGKRF